MPDFMVVVPSTTRVTLVYTTTAVITIAHVLGGLGLLGVATLGFTDVRRRRSAPMPALEQRRRPGAGPPKGSGARTERPMQRRPSARGSRR
jgi:hypothetical protein